MSVWYRSRLVGTFTATWNAGRILIYLSDRLCNEQAHNERHGIQLGGSRDAVEPTRIPGGGVPRGPRALPHGHAQTTSLRRWVLGFRVLRFRVLGFRVDTNHLVMQVPPLRITL